MNLLHAGNLARNIQFWLEHLDDVVPEDRLRAVRAIARLGEELKAAVPEAWQRDDAWPKGVVTLLADADPEVRCRAAEIVSLLGPEAAGAVEALGECLTDGQAVVRRWAACALGEIGPEARPAVPLLLAALNAVDVKERAVAAVALRKILYGIAD